jgi:hypothetical protein
MMFILGDADYRTPPGAGGEQFFRALKYKKIPTVMVRFPRESHELSRSGEPWHRVERLENIVNWFDLYLKGKCEPQYDVAPKACVESREERREKRERQIQGFLRYGRRCAAFGRDDERLLRLRPWG